jgi:hypothetical protein
VLATARYQNFSLLKKVVGLEGLGLPAFGDYMLKTTTQINSANKLSFVAMYNPESYVKTIEDVLATDTLGDASLGKGSSSKALIGVNLRTLIGKSSFIKNVVYFRGIFGDDTFGTSYPTVNLQGKITNGAHLPYNDKLTALKNNQREVGYRSIFTLRSNKKLLSGQITDIVFTAGVDLARIDMNYTRSAAQPDTGYIFTSNDSRPSTNQKYVLSIRKISMQDFKTTLTMLPHIWITR